MLPVCHTGRSPDHGRPGRTTALLGSWPSRSDSWRCGRWSCEHVQTPSPKTNRQYSSTWLGYVWGLEINWQWASWQKSNFINEWTQALYTGRNSCCLIIMFVNMAKLTNSYLIHYISGKIDHFKILFDNLNISCWKSLNTHTKTTTKKIHFSTQL